MKNTREAKIVINGQELTEAQSMTMRVSIETFYAFLSDTSTALGSDPHGVALSSAYRNRMDEIRNYMYANSSLS
jgi:DNA-binding beta-propeller fold protein YncE